MKEKKYLTLQKVCLHYDVSEDLLSTMEEYELIEVVYADDDSYIKIEEIIRIERYLRLYSDLGINVEGFCVINDLLQERETLKEEIRQLKNKL